MPFQAQCLWLVTHSFLAFVTTPASVGVGGFFVRKRGETAGAVIGLPHSDSNSGKREKYGDDLTKSRVRNKSEAQGQGKVRHGKRM